MANIYQTNEVILKPELTDEFLATLVKAARTCGWDVDHSETYQFVRWCFNTAGKAHPKNMEPFMEREASEDG